MHRVLLPLAWMAVIFALSAQSDLDSGLGLIDFITRKIGHVLSYAALTWMWLWALRDKVSNPLRWAVTISFLYAISDEYHQSHVEGRHGTPIDVAIDSVGIALVAAWERRARASRARSP